MKTRVEHILFGLIRISLGLIFLWAFFDKLFGLGFSTLRDKSWLAGASPTYGFLTNAVRGPFAELFHALASSVTVEWLFMLGLLFIGLALILGICMRMAAIFGSLMLLLMWLAVFPPANNPLLDNHVIYLLVLLALGFSHVGRWLSLGNLWSHTALVKRFKWLE